MVFRYVVKIISLTLLCSCSFDSVNYNTERNITAEFQDGDIAFRLGRSLESQAVILASSQGHHSHVGIILATDSGYCVVHEVPYEGYGEKKDIIRCQPINQFYGTQLAETGIIYTIELDTIQRSNIRNYLLKQLENKTPFDHDYNLDDQNEQYCCELVWNAYLKANIDITEGRRTKVKLPLTKDIYIMPSDIEENIKLIPIYNL